MFRDRKLAVGKSTVTVRLFQSGEAFGLCLIGPHGRPEGRGITMSLAAAKRMAQAMTDAPTDEACAGIVWAALGYGTKDRRPLASTWGHPGSFKVA